MFNLDDTSVFTTKEDVNLLLSCFLVQSKHIQISSWDRSISRHHHVVAAMGGERAGETHLDARAQLVGDEEDAVADGRDRSSTGGGSSRHGRAAAR
jgi:hypothetical protein